MDTTFVPGTVVMPDWLNDVNDHVYAPHEIISVFDYMSDAQIASVQARNHVEDVTVALQTAIAAAGDYKKLFWPAGSYKITSGLHFTAQRSCWEGAGRFATEIFFAPTANGTALTLGVIGDERWLCSLKGFGFYSEDTTYTKVAIDCIDLRHWFIEDIGINGLFAANSSRYWSGGTGSTGILFRGRELCTFRDVFIAADKPLQISVNPNLAAITADHCHFHYFGLYANGFPSITVDSGVNLTQSSFKYHSWNLGTSGFQWIDTTTTSVSNGLTFEVIRGEQGKDPTAYLFDIQHNYELQALTIRGAYGGIDRQGIRLRKVSNVTIDNHTHGGAGTEALNVDATVKRIEIRNSFWQTGATATMTGQRLVWSSTYNPGNAPLPVSGLFDESVNPARTMTFGAAFSGETITLANNATLALASNISGDVGVVTSEGFGAVYYCHGAQNLVDLVAGTTASTFFSNTLGTAAKVNLGFTGGQYTIENRRGSTIKVRVTVRGSYGAI